MTHSTRPTLVILRHLGTGLYGEETLSALLVLASFEQPLQLCLTGDALLLLHPDLTGSPLRIQQMLDSLEFYDLLPVWVTASVPDARLATVPVDLDTLDLSDFAQVLTW